MQDPKSVERLRQGDVATLKRLFKANHAKVFPLVFRLTKDREATDLIIRDSFKQLWKDRKDLDPFETIFLRILSYASRLAEKFRDDNGVTGIAGGARTEAGEEIVGELESLPEDTRLAYLLHVIDGYSVREIARAFDKEEDYVRETVGMALVQLNEVFEADLDRQVGTPDSKLWP